MTLHNHQRSPVKVLRFILARTGNFQNMEYRPWHTEITNDRVLNSFSEATRGAMHVDKTSLSTVASEIIKPLSHTLGTVPVHNGWGSGRCRFFMEVEIDQGLGFSQRQFINGYTDHDGLSLTGAIDPNMKLIFNNTSTVSSALDNSTNRVSLSVRDSSQIITPFRDNDVNAQWRNGFQVASAVETNMMRPMDLFGALSIDSNPRFSGASDLRSSVDSVGLCKSRRTNMNPADYLVRSINGLVNAELANNIPAAARIGGDDQASSVYTAARGRVAEGLIAQDSFLSLVNSKLSYSVNGYVTYSNLCKLFPELPSVTKPANVGQATMGHAGNSQHFNGNDIETITANLFINSCAAVMTECALQSVELDLSNDTLGGQPKLDVHRVHSYTNCDLTAYGRMFMSKLIAETLPIISHNGQIPITMYAKIDLNGISIIMLSYNHGPSVRYEIPSFADSRFTPVITTDSGVIQNTAFDIETLANMVCGTTPMQSSRGQNNNAFGQQIQQPMTGNANASNRFNFGV